MMLDPMMVDVQRIGILVYVDPASAGAPAKLRSTLESELVSALGRSLSRGAAVDRLEMVDSRLLEPGRLTFLLHVLWLPASSIMPGGTGSLATLSLRRFRHGPELPPPALFETPPIPLHVPADAASAPGSIDALLGDAVGRLVKGLVENQSPVRGTGR